MSELDPGVRAIVDAIADDGRRADALVLIDAMAKAAGAPAHASGANMIGFGHVHYRYESGREGDTAVLGFAPRKAETVLYMGWWGLENPAALDALGKIRRGKSCVYVKRLADVDAKALATVLKAAAVRNAKG